jgi:hypothetical protein
VIENPRKLSVRAYGGSALNPQIGRVSEEDHYIRLLREWWRDLPEFDDVHVIERTRSGEGLESLRRWWRHDSTHYFETPSEVLILACGGNDCAHRPLTVRERQLVELLPPNARKRVNDWVKKNRPWLAAKRRKRNVPPGGFAWQANDWLTKATAAHERVYFVNILPTTPQIEARSPGLGETVVEYNEILAKTIRELRAPNLRLIDIHGLITDSPDPNDEFVDHTWHPTVRTHRHLFEMIRDLEIEYGVGQGVNPLQLSHSLS